MTFVHHQLVVLGIMQQCLLGSFTVCCQYNVNLRRDDGEVFLSRWPLIEVVCVAWFFHNIAGCVVEVSISLSLL